MSFSFLIYLWGIKQIIQDHPELEHFVGLDVDPLAHEKAQTHINMLLKGSRGTASELQVCMLQKNFKHIKSVLTEVDHKLLIHGVDGILMDLGVSSMQVSSYVTLLVSVSFSVYGSRKNISPKLSFDNVYRYM